MSRPMKGSATMVLTDPQYWEDYRWAKDNIRALDEYRDQWVAIVDKTPVAHGKDYFEVRHEAKAKTKRAYPYLIYVECNAPIISV